MDGNKLSPRALALLYLRLLFRWSRERLAAATGYVTAKNYARYETGERSLSRDKLVELVAPMRVPREAVDILLWFHDQIAPLAQEGREAGEAAAPAPEDLTPAERWWVFRAALAAGWEVVVRLRDKLTRQIKARKVAALRRQAAVLVERLKAATPEERRRLVESEPAFRGFAVAEKLCHDSEKAASHSVAQAHELAQLALFVAEREAGGAARQARTAGYCQPFVANAWRVATEFDAADQAFRRAWELWQAGQAAALPLAEWRLFDLEASLRRAQQRFGEALERLDRARELCGSNRWAMARILTKRATVLILMEDYEGSLAALRKAKPAAEAVGDSDLLWHIRFNTAVNLCHLERFARAAGQLPELRDLAIQKGRELQVIRVLWLSGKVAAGLGRLAEATKTLVQVRREFTDRNLPYEAALSSLDLAVLYLREGRTAEVAELALAMGWIFKAKGIEQKALAALRLFCEAAERAAASVELAKDVINKVERIQRLADPCKP